MKEIKNQILDDIISRIIYTIIQPSYPELLMIPARYRPSPYPTEAPPGPDEPIIYECDLCSTSFENEGELSKHIVLQH